MTKTILIVEDNELNMKLFHDLVEAIGYRAVGTANGFEAMDIARQQMPDLILMDVVMPGMNGFQATRSISKDEATKHIPVIMCTSKNQETDMVWARRQGAVEYVVKPVDSEELLAKIAAL